MAIGEGTDLMWFLGFLGVFFFLWIIGGGPQRAEQNGLGEVKVGDRYSNRNYQRNIDREPVPTTTTPRQPTFTGDGQIIY
jgi:hypothetical protein